MSRDPEVAKLTTQVHDVVTKAVHLSLELGATIGVLGLFEPRFTQLVQERRQTSTLHREAEERRHA